MKPDAFHHVNVQAEHLWRVGSLQEGELSNHVYVLRMTTVAKATVGDIE